MTKGPDIIFPLYNKALLKRLCSLFLHFKKQAIELEEIQNRETEMMNLFLCNLLCFLLNESRLECLMESGAKSE